MLYSIFFVMKKCLFVGSFNPVTIAHIEISKYLLKENIIDYLYFLPVNSKKTNLVNIEKRIEMLNLVNPKDTKILNIYEFQKEGTFNTTILKKITKKYKINYLVMGQDLLLKLENFVNYKTILKNYYLIIIKRLNEKIEPIIKEKFLKYQDKFIIINKRYHESSTLARSKISFKNNKYISKEILDYIKENNLYN